MAERAGLALSALTSKLAANYTAVSDRALGF
jgi:hypothetical protein